MSSADKTHRTAQTTQLVHRPFAGFVRRASSHQRAAFSIDMPHFSVNGTARRAIRRISVFSRHFEKTSLSTLPI